MFTTGFINLNNPKILISPITHNSVDEVLAWITNLLIDGDFSLEISLSAEQITSELNSHQLVKIKIEARNAAILLGNSKLMDETIEEYKQID